MLRLLRIRNLAVVAEVDVDFAQGFTVLTGETGAGKSIIVEALSLLLGGRATSDLVRTGEPMATVEAMFDDDGTEIVVRREVTAHGRSRAFVNGELTTSATLRTLARLVELHGQHEHHALLDPSSHVPTLDEFAQFGTEVASVAVAWEELQRAQSRYARASLDTRERAARLELAAFQLAEIRAAAPKPGEDEELQTARRLLANAERIERLSSEAYEALYETDGSVLGQLAAIWRRVEELSVLDSRFTEHLESRGAVKAQLEDLASTLRLHVSGVEGAPQRLQAVEERLTTLQRVKKKYGPSLSDVLALEAALAAEHEQLANPELEERALEQQVATARARFLEGAVALSHARREAAGRFEEQMATMLGQLAMRHARIEVQLTQSVGDESTWSARGLDSGEFLLAPNPGEAAKPLARIASGGELSRVMLALKTLSAEYALGTSRGRTLVFDEVDAGIGGEVADVVARHLQRLGQSHQVLCVTHLPQIAARAGHHYGVSKRTVGDRTRVSVTHLDSHTARVDELARMIGGASVTEPLRASARELLARGAWAKSGK